MDATVADLRRALEASPEDFTLHLILADRHEELGDQDAAECLRWMAERGKRPLQSDVSGGFAWYDERMFAGSDDPASDLPTRLFGLVHGDEGRKNDFSDIAFFDTLTEAYEAVFRVFRQWRVGG